MKKLKIAAVIGILLLVSSIIIGVKMSEMNNNNTNLRDEGIIKVYNFDVTQKHIERSLVIADFEEIELGCSLEEIETILGEPNGWIGSGILSPYYSLQNDEYIVLYFDNPFAYQQLNCIRLVNDKKVLEIIKSNK